MAAVAINPPPVNGGESKSARKKKAKVEAAADSATHIEIAEVSKEEINADGHADQDTTDHPHIKELQKQIRNINKKLAATQKTDAVLAENPGVSLDDLVAQRKINNDQKASILKKPQLQAQISQLDDQIRQFRQFEAEFKAQLQQQKQELDAHHEQEMNALKAKIEELEARPEPEQPAPASNPQELREKLLIFSQFLRTAASKRAVEEDALAPENMAFEGALLLVYGGDDKAVDAAVNLVEGSDAQVPGIDGELLPVKYSQIKEASIDISADDTLAATVDASTTQATDPTVANAGLTELNEAGEVNGVDAHSAQETLTGTGDESSNQAGERWDTTTRTDSGGLEESYEIIPRPNEEVDTPMAATGNQEQSTSWADDTPAPTSGNTAGENWDTKAPGESASWADEPVAVEPADDGFQQIPNRPRGRGGRGRGDSEGRGGRGGRGGRVGHRGDGEAGRGRGRGGFRGGRGDVEAGRGRSGRGRGPRGDGGAPRAA